MFIVYLSLLAAQAFGATTHKPRVTYPHATHPTQEPIVTDGFSFKYDPKMHMMAAMTRKQCFIYSMSVIESTDVHTVHGLHNLEIKLINMVDDTTQTYALMSHDDVNAASHFLATNCNIAGWTSYKLN